ncbi:hypothetical protein TWF694_011429 [Orbilia ellipsospora]|uniref:Uncharacterized protein n=1 Tax=Orbilia ellipsospora TaxID=2528407 RepID=A0AAV9X576_9PEZI
MDYYATAATAFQLDPEARIDREEDLFNEMIQLKDELECKMATIRDYGHIISEHKNVIMDHRRIIAERKRVLIQYEKNLLEYERNLPEYETSLSEYEKKLESIYDSAQPIASKIAEIELERDSIGVEMGWTPADDSRAISCRSHSNPPPISRSGSPMHSREPSGSPILRSDAAISLKSAFVGFHERSGPEIFYTGLDDSSARGDCCTDIISLVDTYSDCTPGKRRENEVECSIDL